MTHTITLIPGDGTGPEISEATRRVLEATGVPIEWDPRQAGTNVMEKEGTPLPDAVIDSTRRNKVAIKGPVTTPVGTGFRSVNVALRKALNLYACVRPYKTYPGVGSRYENIDVVVVRENTGDPYAGSEFERGDPAIGQISELYEQGGMGRISEDGDLRPKIMSERSNRPCVETPSKERQ